MGRNFKPISALRIELSAGGTRQVVGRLAWRERVCYVEYDPAFLATKLELSPFKMRLAPGLIQGPENVFERLHGLIEHIRAVARNVGVSEKAATATIEQVSAAVSRWSVVAKAHGVSRKSANAVDERLKDVRRWLYL